MVLKLIEKLVDLLTAAVELVVEMQGDMAKDDHRRARVEDFLHDAREFLEDE